jgi:hypothetical protein
VDKTTTLNDAQNEKSNSSANEAQKTRPFSFLGLMKELESLFKPLLKIRRLNLTTITPAMSNLRLIDWSMPPTA